MKKQVLLNELRSMTQNILERAQNFEALPEAILKYKGDGNAWNALECLDHLNRYGNFYLPEIEKVIATAPETLEGEFKSGWLGHKSAISMLPQEDGLKKMKTFKSKNPAVDGLQPYTFKNFIRQQNEFLKLIDAAAKVNLTKTKTATTLPLLRFRLGDTLRFVIYHNERHLMQAERMVAQAKAALHTASKPLCRQKQF